MLADLPGSQGKGPAESVTAAIIMKAESVPALPMILREADYQSCHFIASA